MKVIYLVRHGQASFGERDYDKLSPLGHEQSELVANYLTAKGIVFDAVFGGSLTRHQQTAQPWLVNHAKHLIVNQHWNEFNHEELIQRAKVNHASKVKNLKHASNERLLELFSLAVKDWINPENDHQYFETWPAFNERVSNALTETIVNTEKYGLVFTSGGVIASIIGRCWQLDAQQTMKLNWTLVNTGVTKLLIDGRSINVSTINEYPHLDNEKQKFKITYK